MEIHKRKRRVGRAKKKSLKYSAAEKLPPWITRKEYVTGFNKTLKELLDKHPDAKLLRQQMSETIDTGEIAKLTAEILPLWISNRELEVERSVIKFMSEVPDFLATEINNLTVRNRARRQLMMSRSHAATRPENNPKNASRHVLEAYREIEEELRPEAEKIVLENAAKKWREKYASEET